VVILATSPQKSPTKFIMDSYWDLYVAYVAKCIKENKEQDIDPEHYEMEWNHFLPQCIFGDQPAGQYLLLRQHAIATALQTLAFKKNCMTGMMKKYLPSDLLELAWPYYGLASSKRMSGEGNPMFGRTGELNPMFGKKDPAASERMKLRTGELHPMFGRKRPDTSEMMKLRTGELHPMYGKKNPGASAAMKKRTGKLNPNYGKKCPAVSERNKKQTGELNPSHGKKWWVNSEGEVVKSKESPGPEWQNGRKFKQTEVTQ
jgi:hypothetical protein